MDKKFELNFAVNIDNKINFAMQQNNIAIFKEIVLANQGEQSLYNLTLRATSEPSFFEATPLEIAELCSNSIVEITDFAVQLNHDFFASLNKAHTATICFELLDGEQQILTDTKEVEVLPFDYWTGASLPELTASFVLPNEPFVKDICLSAMEIAFVDGVELNGYLGDRQDVANQTSAIYYAVAAHKISAVQVANKYLEGQRIKLPHEIFKHKHCSGLDLALLFAAAFEANGINPIIIFNEGKCLVGAWLTDAHNQDIISDDLAKITKALQLQELLVFDPISATSELQFLDAAKNGAQTIDNKFEFFIDIKRARLTRILPLNIKIDEQSESGSFYTVLPKQSIQEIKIATEEVVPTHIKSQKPKRYALWENSLLDLSKRSPLINFKLDRAGIPLFANNIELLEKQFALLNQFAIISGVSDKQPPPTDELIEAELKQKRILSKLDNKDLSGRLTRIYRAANQTQEDSGSNILYLALGFLKWIEQGHKAPLYAPVLLVPLEITRKSATSGYSVRSLDEDAQLNLSLVELLRNYYGINCDSVAELLSSGASVNKILTEFTRLIVDFKGWELVSAASIGLFNFSKLVMWQDLENRMDTVLQNPIVKSLIDGKLDPRLIYDDAKYNKKMHNPLSADSSQIAAIEDALSGKSFVLHGPPGTGKSQTIANLICSAMADGKTVLFIAEKMAALSVVKRRLELLGLSDFILEIYSQKSKKREVLSQFESSFSVKQQAQIVNFENQQNKMLDISGELNGFCEALHRHKGAGISVYDAIAGYISLNNIEYDGEVYESALANIKKDSKDKADIYAKFADATSAATEFTSYCTYSFEPCESAFFGINNADYSSALKSDVVDTAKLVLKHHKQAEEAQSLFHQSLGIGEDLTKKAYGACCLLMRLCKTQPQNILRFLTHHNFEAASVELGIRAAEGVTMLNLENELSKYFTKGIFEIDAQKLYDDNLFASLKKGLGKTLAQNKIKKRISQFLINPKRDKKAFDQFITLLHDRYQLSKGLQKFNDTFLTLFEGYSLSDNRPDYNAIKAAIDWAKKAREQIEILKECVNIDVSNALMDFCGTDFTEYCNSADTFIQHCNRLDELLMQPPSQEPSFVGHSRARAESYINNISQLKEYCYQLSLRHKTRYPLYRGILDKVFSGQLHSTELQLTYIKTFYRLFLECEIEDDPILSSFIRASFENTIRKFVAIDEHISQIAAKEVYYKCASRIPNIANASAASSEPYFLNRAIKSGGRKLPIRKLLEQIPNLLFKIKPCFLMSPMSAAQYLGDKYTDFDLVIFDEASQLLTADAVGSISRARTAVIVGDPKQLPPTTFFELSSKSDDDSDDVSDMESLIDDVLALNIRQKYLLWHYRSSHESLIAFSNKNFYDDSLITFPSFDDLQQRIFLNNTKGVYDRGKSKTNKIEANAVVKMLFEFLAKNKGKPNHDSIGIITFSINQQLLIQDLIDEKLKKQPDMEIYFSKDIAEPVFVKNLENVQGDERDIILFSTTYGKDTAGKMSVNFGPINKDGGGRRLNVAVSRARKYMYIMTSINSDDIDLSRTAAKGAADFKAFLRFAENAGKMTGRGQKQDGFDQRIIHDISQSLNKEGYLTAVNIGRSRNRVDIAVCDPTNQSRFILGILIDGKNYNSYNAARDRDILKEMVLKRLGWNTMRVFVLDWFADKNREIFRIKERIRELESGVNKEGEKALTEAIFKLDFKLEDERDVQKKRIESISVQTSYPYQKAVLSTPKGKFFDEVSKSHIAQCVNSLVNTESPISATQVKRAITTLYGISLTAQVNTYLERVLKQAEFYKTRFNGNDFYWNKPQRTMSYYRHNTEGVKRVFSDICLEEYCAAIGDVMSFEMSCKREDLIRAVSKRFGFARVTQDVYSTIDLCVKHMIDTKQLNEGAFDMISTEKK